MHWMVSRLNRVFSDSGVQFWLQSHDVYCTDGVAEWEGDQFSPYSWSKVGVDLEMLFPHAKLYDLSSDSLSRESWLEKGDILYGDPHGITLYIHNTYVTGTSGQQFKPDILPQHGYGPWYAPSVVFMFLSAITWAPGWEFDPELTPAHEVGHALGLNHTLDTRKTSARNTSGESVRRFTTVSTTARWGGSSTARKIQTARDWATTFFSFIEPEGFSFNVHMLGLWEIVHRHPWSQ